jgi:predicted metalloprotease
MTKIRSRDSRMIDDRRRQSSGGSSSGGGRSGGGLGDILGGALGGGGSGGGGLGGGIKAGGGMIGILVLLATLFLPKLLGGVSGQDAGIGGGSIAASSESTGGDEDTCGSEAEQILCGATIDVQEFWLDEFPQSFNQEYEVTSTVFFSGFTNTGCG